METKTLERSFHFSLEPKKSKKTMQARKCMYVAVFEHNGNVSINTFYKMTRHVLRFSFIFNDIHSLFLRLKCNLQCKGQFFQQHPPLFPVMPVSISLQTNEQKHTNKNKSLMLVHCNHERRSSSVL